MMELFNADRDDKAACDGALRGVAAQVLGKPFIDACRVYVDAACLRMGQANTAAIFMHNYADDQLDLSGMAAPDRTTQSEVVGVVMGFDEMALALRSPKGCSAISITPDGGRANGRLLFPGDLVAEESALGAVWTTPAAKEAYANDAVKVAAVMECGQSQVCVWDGPAGLTAGKRRVNPGSTLLHERSRLFDPIPVDDAFKALDSPRHEFEERLYKVSKDLPPDMRKKREIEQVLKNLQGIDGAVN